MKLITWNVNGIRAIENKGFAKWFEAQNADAVCLQETKASADQLSVFLREPKGYRSHWFSAQKAGYSGTAIYTRRDPVDVVHGLGIAEFDAEGRVLTLVFPEYHLICAYFPNSQREGVRLPFKLRFCEAMLAHIEKLRCSGRNVILCGDFNIAHREIDLKNPKTNQSNAGFLPQERAWMEKLVGADSEANQGRKNPAYIDTFRHFEPDARDHYTWWSYRPGVRAKNIGWRIDYFVTNPELKDRLKAASHQPTVMGSDHCPVVLELKA